MSANETLSDLQIQHALHLLKVGNGIEADILKLLAEGEKELVAKIGQRMAAIDERGFDLGPKTTKRLNDMLDEIRAVSTGVYSKAHDELVGKLKTLATNELEFHPKALATATGVKVQANLASPQLLTSIVTERPMNGALLKPWMAGVDAATSQRVEAVIRQGIAQGKSIDAMVRDIMGSKAQNYQDGILNKSRTSVRAIVRTSVNHVNNHAQQETWKRNSNVVKGWMFVATLDSRTTLICASNDGHVFPIGEGPIPPLHPNCRSTTTAVTKSFEEMGLKRKDYSPDQRASLDGSIPKPTNFEAWLKAKPEEFQNTILGKARGDLWRAGKYQLTDFVRDRREVIPLSELQKLHPEPVTPVVVKASAPEVVPQVIDVPGLDKEAKAYVLERGRATGNEHLIAFDANSGTEFARDAGDRDSVTLNQRLKEALADSTRAIVLHHNHPRSSSLSLPDVKIGTLSPGAQGIWAHGHDGASFYAERGELELKVTTVSAISDAIHQSVQRKINLGEVDVEDAQIIFQHLVWLAVHNVRQVKYTANLAGATLAAWNRNKAYYEALIEGMKP